jgi:AP-1 complex subunit gamma-1
MPTTGAILDMFQRILADPSLPRTTREYILNAIMKLSSRTADEGPRIRNFIAQFRENMDEELQQRAAEYTSIFSSFDHLRPGLLERMPVAKSKVRAVAVDEALEPVPVVTSSNGDGDLLDLLGGEPTPAPSASYGVSGGGGDMLDLLGGLDLGGGSSSAPLGGHSGGGGGGNDLLDLMGGGGASASAGVSSAAQPSGGMDLLGDLLGGLSSSAAPPQPAAMQQQSGTLRGVFVKGAEKVVSRTTNLLYVMSQIKHMRCVISLAA